VRQRLYDYLLDRAAGASPRELLDLVFTHPGSDPEFGPRFLHGMLGTDPRFVWRESEGTWHARVHDALAQPIAETTFVVLDLETTGFGASASGIIEIGAARICNGRVIEEFEQLVNPGTPLPPFITRLTGIDDTMLADQPPIGAVWPRLRAFLGDAVLVAHNARFDLSFLDTTALCYDGAPLPNPHLCTIKLARRLLPQVRKRGLDALAAHFTIPQADRHRALGDVRITVEVLFHLMESMRTRGIVRLDQALDLQHCARDGRRFEYFLPREKVQQLPTAPGTYYLLDGDGRLLYIGKAKNLRDRVSHYLTNSESHSNKTLDLIRHAHDVRVEVAGSELEAALDEAAAIRRHQPPYNRLGKHLPRIAFVKLTLASEFPRLLVTARLGGGRARYVGPFRNREEAARVVGLLTRLFRLRTCPPRLQPSASVTPCMQGQVGACSAPCAAHVDAAGYAKQVEAFLALLGGDGAAAEQELIKRRDRLAESLRFEAATKVQRDVRLLQSLMRRQRLLGWVMEGRNFLILQPSVGRQAVLAYVVLGGRLALRARLHDADAIIAIADQIPVLAEQYERRAIRRDEVDGTTIVAAWLRDRGEADGCVLPIDDPLAPATRQAEWRDACGSLLTPVVDAHYLSTPQAENQRQQEQRPGGPGTVAVFTTDRAPTTAG